MNVTDGGVVRCFEFSDYGNVQDSSESYLKIAGMRSGAVVYSTTPDNLIKGARKRLFGVRENDILLHRSLIANQITLLSRPGLRDDIITHFQRNLRMFEGYEEQVHAWVAQPHPKRKLRVSVMEKNVTKGYFLPYDRRAYVDYKLKPEEFLARGKQLRSIGEISDESAFEHGPVASRYKEVDAQTWLYKGSEISFIKGPTDHELSKAFSMLLNPRKMSFVYFSDDACVAIKCKDGSIFRANLDISWADGSMYHPIFDLAADCWCTDAVGGKYAVGSLAQCRKPVKLINNNAPFRGKGRKAPKGFIRVKLNDGYMYLPSGYSGTTLIQNVGQKVFGGHLANKLNRRAPRASRVEEIIKDIASECGLMVKVIPCARIEHLQFLKHSWTWTENGWKPYVNLGPWLRSFGYLKGHMYGDGEMTLTERFNKYMGDVVLGRENWGQSRMSECFKQAFPVVGPLGVNDHLLVDEKKKSMITPTIISDQTIYNRYGVTPAEWDNFVDLLQSYLGAGYELHHPVVDKIMEMDYGYHETVWSEDKPFVAFTNLNTDARKERQAKWRQIHT